MRAADVMEKDLVTVSPELTLDRFEELLTLEDIGGAPVVDANGALVGIASKTDIVRALSEELSEREQDGFELGAEMQVGDIMTTEVVTVTPGEDVRAVAQRMIDAHVHRVLVVEGTEVVGIITSLDLLRALV
jgi:CBS domain-containing protein